MRNGHCDLCGRATSTLYSPTGVILGVECESCEIILRVGEEMPRPKPPEPLPEEVEVDHHEDIAKTVVSVVRDERGGLAVQLAVIEADTGSRMLVRMRQEGARRLGKALMDGADYMDGNAPGVGVTS